MIPTRFRVASNYDQSRFSLLRFGCSLHMESYVQFGNIWARQFSPSFDNDPTNLYIQEQLDFKIKIIDLTFNSNSS